MLPRGTRRSTHLRALATSRKTLPSSRLSTTFFRILGIVLWRWRGVPSDSNKPQARMKPRRNHQKEHSISGTPKIIARVLPNPPNRTISQVCGLDWWTTPHRFNRRVWSQCNVLMGYRSRSTQKYQTSTIRSRYFKARWPRSWTTSSQACKRKSTASSTEFSNRARKA